MKNSILIFTLMLGLVACGDNTGGGAKSTNGQTPITINAGTNTNANTSETVSDTTNASSTVVSSGAALNTPYSTARSFVPEAILGAEFNKDSAGQVTLVRGDITTQQAMGYGQDCLIPAGSYTLNHKQAGFQASKEHHYQGLVIEAVGPVSFTATVTNLSAKDFQGTWKMQGVYVVSAVGNRSCTGYGLPIELRFTF